MDRKEIECINIFNKINWTLVGVGEDYDYYYLLLLEFLRRATNFADAHNMIFNTPWEVINIVISKGCSLSNEAEEIIEQISNKRIYVHMSLFAFALFEKAKDEGIISLKEINVFSPLLKMFESKGAFHGHHGFIEFNNLSQISLRNKEWIRKRENPYIKFNEYL